MAYAPPGTDYAPPLWCAPEVPHNLEELGTASGLPQPNPGPQFTISLGPGLGAKWRKKDVFFFFFLPW